MRPIVPDNTLNRLPETGILVRDVMPRWKDLTTSAYATGYPAQYDGDGIAQCLSDAARSIMFSGPVRRAWCVGSDTVRVHNCADPTDAAEWENALSVTDYTTTGAHRISVEWGDVYYGNGGDIYYNSIVRESGAYTVADDHIALAALPNGDIFLLTLHELCEFKYLRLEHFGSGSVYSECPHTIVVPDDYNEASLSWFDAARHEYDEGRAIIVLNEKTHGHPVVIFYEDGIWSQPRPLLPQDIVDNYSFLRIGHVSSIEDYSGNPCFFATGRIGRKGSTGARAQEWDVLLRSRDGEHWTVDRYSYICEEAMAAKMIQYDDYVYYPGGSTVKQSPRTWLVGGDPEFEGDQQFWWVLFEDILNWQYSQPKAGGACRGISTIATHNGTYTPYRDAGIRYGLHPGYWLWRYAWYTSQEEVGLLSTETIDEVVPTYKAGDRALSLQSRDASMRMLIDWASDQDWQWLSQTKHYDDCDKMDYLYSIGAAMIDVNDITDYDISGTVEEQEVVEEPEDEPNTGLTFQAYNKPGIFLTTKPFDARNFVVRHRFTYTNEYVVDLISPPFGLGNTLALDTEQGVLTVGATTLRDTGQDFTDWNQLQLDGPLNNSHDPYYAMVCVVSVVHTDGCISWGYIGECVGGDPTIVRVYTHEVNEAETEYQGWNGASVAGKTADRYYISWLPRVTRLGYGAGVVGCVADKHNLIAAFFDMIGDDTGGDGYGPDDLAANGYFYILVRRPHTDKFGNDIGVWLPVARTAVSYTPSQSELYDVEMRRNGRKITARLANYFVPDGSDDPLMMNIAELEYEWSGNGRMIPNDGGDDRCKVGVITNVQVAECRVLVVREDDTYIARALGYHWPLKPLDPGDPNSGFDYSDNAIPWFYPDARSQWPWDASTNFLETDDYEPLWINGEEMKILQRTASDKRSVYQWVHDKYDPEAGRQKIIQGRWGTGGTATPARWAHTDIAPWLGCDESPDGPLDEPCWGDDWDDFGWIFKASDGPGAGATGLIKWCHTTPSGDDDHTDNYFCDTSASGTSTANQTMSDEDYNRIVPAAVSSSPGTFTFFNTLPGFEVSRRPDYRGTRHHPHESIARSHHNDALQIRRVWAYDDEHDKNLEWTLVDIATKAGVLDYDLKKSIDATHTVTAGAGPTWLSDVNSDPVFTRDFDITLEVDALPAVNGQYFGLVARSTSNVQLQTGSAWSLDGVSAIRLDIYTFLGATHIRVTQTNTNIDDWTEVDNFILDDYLLAGKRLRFVGYNDTIALYINECWIHTFHFGDIFGTEHDGYSAPAAGYVGLYSLGFNVQVNVTQPELWSWTDGIILDQRMNAAAGMKRAIRDRRVKWLSRADGALAISLFDSRDDLGTITDHIYTDKSAPTDRIPTHIRAIGEEISEYLDHASAAEYGITFAVINTPHLDEEEAFKECQRTSKDARSISGARNLFAAGRLNWEPEDSVTVDYEPADGGPPVRGTFVVTTVKFSFKPGDLTTTSAIREEIE
ncbi:MAG: hypothetical protein GY832_11200 [Chloroflexi bacterium]|nr:hypothetical protein [Chloroflexota bacterium]